MPRTDAKPGDAERPQQPVDVLVPAEPILPVANPPYPRTVLGREKMPVVLGVRISVDATGRVTDVGSSLRILSFPGSHGEEFWSSVRETVSQWRFTPAEKRTLKLVNGSPGKEDYWLVTRAEKTEYVFDLTFNFTSTGEVRSEIAK